MGVSDSGFGRQRKTGSGPVVVRHDLKSTGRKRSVQSEEDGVTNNSSWIWRKLLELREQVRPYFLSVVGDGLSTNAWDDKWIVNGILSRMIPFRIFQSLGFSKQSMVAEVVQVLGSVWPTPWTDRVSSLSTVPIPSLQAGVKDQILWLNLQDHSRRFTIKEVWNSLLGPWQPVLWYDLCWFKHHVPKHSFCAWLAFLDRLPTQDRMVAWVSNMEMLVCSLCKEVMDSRDHIFFQCQFSRVVWRTIRDDLDNYRDGDWSLIMQDLIHRRWKPGEEHKKCLFVGAFYYIWQERDRRLFDGRKRNPPELVRELRTFLDIWKNGLCDLHIDCGEASVPPTGSTVEKDKPEVHTDDQGDGVDKGKEALEGNNPQNISDKDFVHDVVSNICNDISNVVAPTGSTVEKGDNHEDKDANI
ncbi:hypothetical protein OSB04_018908 [Centaurea solstitialis]|uniref:Reverse transcriptase zinc-binding domain-containing protein n=1 Tax=Centaurea solstitialis TaxID=347529 RepID=A0AA38WBV6_9ASTR|nr:hypothetical protein OSB04_018908 [Centaurea solstitialis]